MPKQSILHTTKPDMQNALFMIKLDAIFQGRQPQSIF